MINSDSYDKFCSGDFQVDLSSLYVNGDGDIEACLLISDQGAQEGFTVEYANTRDCKDKIALLQMFKFSADKILDFYSDDSLSGYALAVNDVTSQIIQKAFPHSRVIDHCSVFVNLLGSE